MSWKKTDQGTRSILQFTRDGNPVFADAIAPMMNFPNSTTLTLMPGNYVLALMDTYEENIGGAFGTGGPAFDSTRQAAVGVNIIPAPGALGAFGLAGVGLLRRRRA